MSRLPAHSRRPAGRPGAPAGGRARTAAATLLAAALLAGSGAALLAGPAAAQELAGTALDPDGQPLVGTTVALHRVGGGASAFVATDTTGPDGGFRFQLEPDSAIYFAAVRFGGRMYLGPAVQSGTGAAMAGYVLRIDPANEAGAVASALSGQRQGPPAGRSTPGAPATPGSSDTGALLLVGLLALAAAAAFFFAAPRYRERRTRDALIELAALENALADAPAGEEAGLRADRDRIRARLAPRP